MEVVVHRECDNDKSLVVSEVVAVHRDVILSESSSET